MKKVLLLLVAFGVLFACAERKVSTKGEEMPAQEQGMAKPEEVKPETIAPVESGKVEETQPTEMKAGTTMEEDVLKSDIHFDFDKYDIKAEDRPALKKIADWLIANPHVTLRAEGNCDERGTNEYNLGLGERRANAAKAYLMSLGVPAARIKTISYGEEKPLCTEHNESCWLKNRRDHFEIAAK
jgi:peptidoglycan-associated lipoprotein